MNFAGGRVRAMLVRHRRNDDEALLLIILWSYTMVLCFLLVCFISRLLAQIVRSCGRYSKRQNIRIVSNCATVSLPERVLVVIELRGDGDRGSLWMIMMMMAMMAMMMGDDGYDCDDGDEEEGGGGGGE